MIKTLNSLSFFVLLGLLVISCSKSESDFVGKYEFNNCSTVKIADDLNNSFSALFSNKEYVTNAKQFYVLSPVKFNLFVDESDKKLKGEVEYLHVTGDKYGYKSKASKNKMNFDLKNIRLQSDTLWFSISNQLTEMSGKSFKGYIFKQGDKNFIGLDNDFVGKSQYRTNNSSYVSENEELTTFVSYGITNGVKDFYTSQIADFQNQIENEKLDRNAKQLLKNSIEHIEEHYLEN